jgi:tRNA U55 pseudouridine synthase TruB
MVGGIGSKGCYKAHVLREGNFVRVYEMSCKFGIATDTYMTDGKVVEKATTRHVSRERLDRVLTKIESSQRLQMFNSAGIDMNTEAGYQLAAGGLFRPSQKLTMPIIYALKCTKFSHPEFTVEVHVINENPMYLLELVNGIGLSMRSVACVSKMRCTRYGNFTVEQALLRKHWSVEHIINNIQMCEPLTRDNVLKPSSPHLSSPSDDGQTRESFLEML